MSFGLWEKKPKKNVVNNQTDGPGLLTEASCMAKREENCAAFLLTGLLREREREREKKQLTHLSTSSPSHWYVSCIFKPQSH